MCYIVPALFQAVPPVQSHHGCLRLDHCIYGHSGASFSPYGHLERPFQVWKLVPAVQPGCVLFRSSFVPSCATRPESPWPLTARTLHLWPFLTLFGHKMGQNSWNKKQLLWISIQIDPNDNLKTETWEMLTGLTHCVPCLSERSLQWASPLQSMQVILSNAILRPDQQLCSLPKENYLWIRLTNYQICRKWLLRSNNNSGWSLLLVSLTTRVPASTATWWTATGTIIFHSSILKTLKNVFLQFLLWCGQ